MANDPEARSTGSSAVIIAVVALVLIVGLAFVLLNRGGEVADTTVINNPVPSIVDRPGPVPVPGSTTVVTPPAVTPPAVTPPAVTPPASGSSQSTPSGGKGSP